MAETPNALTKVSRKRKCQQCKTAVGEKRHPCPYQQEINDDSATLCNCCAGCAQECANDI